MLFIISTNTCFWIGCFIDDVESYKKIYELKERSFDKPLAIFVKNFDYLKKYTNLTDRQIDYLKNYKKPFTVLVDKKDCKDDYLLENIKNLTNIDKYKKIAFRVAHNKIHKDFIEKNWLFFLTSANKTWQSEIKTIKKLKEVLNNNIQTYNIQVFENNDLKIKTPYSYSDIFEFTENWIHYFRK